MSDQREDQNAAGERVVSERCLCRELLDHLRVHLVFRRRCGNISLTLGSNFSRRFGRCSTSASNISRPRTHRERKSRWNDRFFGCVARMCVVFRILTARSLSRADYLRV